MHIYVSTIYMKKLFKWVLFSDHFEYTCIEHSKYRRTNIGIGQLPIQYHTLNIQTHTSNVIKSLNSYCLISIRVKFRTTFFQLLHSNIDEEIESSLLVNNQIHSHNTRINNQMSILRVNRSKTNSCVLHNGMITWNSLPDVFKFNLSFSMF